MKTKKRTRVRVGTAAEATAGNVYLQSGEMGIESDTYKAKLGPGYWNSLPYLPGWGGYGVVTSVELTVPTDILAVSGSPLTGAGTLAVSKQNQNANLVFAGPPTGGAAQPTFRALVAADIAAAISGDANTVAFFNGSGVLTDNSSELVWNNSSKKLAVGYTNVETLDAYKASIKGSSSLSLGGAFIKGSGSTSSATYALAVVMGNSYSHAVFRDDGKWAIGRHGYLGGDPSTLVPGVSLNSYFAAGDPATYGGTAINGIVTGGIGATAIAATVSGHYAIGIGGYGTSATGMASVSIGMFSSTTLDNTVMIGTNYEASGLTNTLSASVALGTGYSSAVGTSYARPTVYFQRDSGMILPQYRTMATSDFDRLAGNAIHGYIYNPYTSTINVSAVNNDSGRASFVGDGSGNIQVGEEVVISGFTNYTNGTYYVAGYGFLSSTRAGAFAGTGLIAYTATDTGTMVVINRRPTASYANVASLYLWDNGSDNATWWMRTEGGIAGSLVAFETKNTAGDPTAFSGRLVDNTADGTLKLFYSGGSVNLLASGSSYQPLDADLTAIAALSVARGAIIYGNSTPQWTLLALGASGKFLQSDGTDLGYSAYTMPTSLTLGDTFYASGTGAISKLAFSASNYVLRAANATTAPAWGKVTEDFQSLSDVTTLDVTSTKHGYTPKSPADATKFLNGAATPAFAAVKDSDLAVSDIITNNASTSAHGFLKKLDNNDYNYMDGAGNWSEPYDYALRTYKLLGSVILGEPILGTAANITASNGLSNQNMRFIAIYLPKDATLTGVKWYQATQGSYTASNYNGVGLYSYSGGTLTKVASSTDDGNIWKGSSNTWQSKAFSSTYAASAGVYFVGFLYCRSAETTAPAIGFFPLSANAAVGGVDFTNSAKLQGTLSGQTALPSSQAMSGITATTQSPYAGVY